jgi:hypothetical protein
LSVGIAIILKRIEMVRIKLFSTWSDSPYNMEIYQQEKIDLWANANPIYRILNATSSLVKSQIVTTVIYDDGEPLPFDKIK